MLCVTKSQITAIHNDGKETLQTRKLRFSDYRRPSAVPREFRLDGILGDELTRELASECETFPIVLIATAYDKRM